MRTEKSQTREFQNDSDVVEHVRTLTLHFGHVLRTLFMAMVTKDQKAAAMESETGLAYFFHDQITFDSWSVINNDVISAKEIGDLLSHFGFSVRLFAWRVKREGNGVNGKTIDNSPLFVLELYGRDVAHSTVKKGRDGIFCSITDEHVEKVRSSAPSGQVVTLPEFTPAAPRDDAGSCFYHRVGFDEEQEQEQEPAHFETYWPAQWRDDVPTWLKRRLAKRRASAAPHPPPAERQRPSSPRASAGGQDVAGAGAVYQLATLVVPKQ